MFGECSEPGGEYVAGRNAEQRAAEVRATNEAQATRPPGSLADAIATAGDAVRAREAKSEAQVEAEGDATVGFLLGEPERKMARQTDEVFNAGDRRELEGRPPARRTTTTT